MIAIAIPPKRLIGMDTEFTGPYPRFLGALSAVTGGPPEDINMMPASLDPERDGPTYDGSSLSPVRQSGNLALRLLSKS